MNNSNPANPNFNCMSLGAKPSSQPIVDQRVYNLLVLTPGGKYIYDDFKNPLLTLPLTRQRRVVSAFFRLHATRTTNYGGAVTGGPCETFETSTQIGCLVKANPCSIGIARLQAVDDATNMAFQIGGSFRPSREGIAGLVTGSLLAYPMATSLWVSAVNAGNVTANENLLLDCFGKSGNTAFVDNLVGGHGLVPVPAGVTRNKTCPATFP